MKEERGNLWNYHIENWICITTNGFVRTDGKAVMGAGCALEAATKYEEFPERLGTAMVALGNIPLVFPEWEIITFPVKHLHYKDADPELIKKSAEKLVQLITTLDIDKIYIPRPGCGAGNLNWCDVKKILEPIFDDRFVIVTFVEDVK
jgi:hypothetical protein